MSNKSKTTSIYPCVAGTGNARVDNSLFQHSYIKENIDIPMLEDYYRLKNNLGFL